VVSFKGAINVNGLLALHGALESKREVHTGFIGKPEKRNIKNFTQFLCHISEGLLLEIIYLNTL
jgi:hypothetical protein